MMSPNQSIANTPAITDHETENSVKNLNNWFSIHMYDG